MCGIVGYVGSGEASEFLIDGLRRLEYRGYDSAGIAVYENGKIQIEKKKGGLANLEAVLKEHPLHGHIGIGHTRWATHGQPSDVNAHPHGDCHNHFVIVHNGIIENYMTLKKELIEKGHVFKSETDTEVVAHLAEELDDGNFLSTVRKVLAKIEGSYSLVFMDDSDPDTIICTKKDNPLIIGLGKGENFIASDIPAVINRTRQIYIMNDYELAVVKKDSITFYDHDDKEITKEIHEVTWSAEAAEKGGYAHFMLKEIHEQPTAIKTTITPRIRNGLPNLEECNITPEALKQYHRIFVVACGTAMHAGVVGQYVIEKLARIPVTVDIASEFRYRDPILSAEDLVIIISQSGETADSLAAMRLAKNRGAKTLAIVNAKGSSIAREADMLIYTHAGPEIAVASTKAYMVQIAVMYLLAFEFALAAGTIDETECRKLVAELQQTPDYISEILKNKEQTQFIASSLITADSLLYIGRGLDYALSMEGSLKLKEISYIHSESYAAGELKHGTISLISDGMPVIAVATQKALFEKTISNIKEVKARGAKVVLVCRDTYQPDTDVADLKFGLPDFDDLLMPMLAVVPLQLIAYYTSVLRGNDVDKPRNLAKSVTVE